MLAHRTFFHGSEVFDSKEATWRIQDNPLEMYGYMRKVVLGPYYLMHRIITRTKGGHRATKDLIVCGVPRVFSDSLH